MTTVPFKEHGPLRGTVELACASGAEGAEGGPSLQGRGRERTADPGADAVLAGTAGRRPEKVF